MQLDYIQLGYINKTEEFQKDIHITFVKRKDLFYM